MERKEINKIISETPRSGIRRIMDKAISMDPEKKEIIHLEVGEPQEPTAEIIKKAAAKAALDGWTKYTQNAGYIGLRKAIVKKLKEQNGVKVTEDNIFVTPGATYAVSIAIGAVINHEDEVLVPDPGYPNFPVAVKHYGGIPKFYSSDMDDGFKIDVKGLEKLVTKKTKMLVVNSPSNPTGAIVPEEDWKKMVEFAKRHNLWVLTDEVYEKWIFEGKHFSPMSLENTDDIIGIYSFSKSYNMTGFRVGYIVTRAPELCASLIKAQELYISAAPAISQITAIEAMEKAEKEADELVKSYKFKLNRVLDILGKHVGYKPQGAFYVLIDVSKTGMLSNEFADKLLMEEKVAVAPGATFGPSADKYIRITLAAPVEELEKGVTRIKRFLEKYGKN